MNRSREDLPNRRQVRLFINCETTMLAPTPPREVRQSNHPGVGLGNPFQIDRDRILYSTAFRRLAGVTQVVSPGEGEIFHNRLTHSLKVAQIARRLAEKFATDPNVPGWGELDPDVTEAAGLAHDLGHPPFGHAAEEELQRLVSRALNPPTPKKPNPRSGEGYEGNAQSFRIITDLAIRRPESMISPNPAKTGRKFGLDLTRATLNATLKYPWNFGGNTAKPNKFGAYGCDHAAFTFARAMQDPKKPMSRSLEAQVMDKADDITYSVHDTEDFYRAGLIPLDRLASNPKERDRFWQNIDDRYAARGETSPTSNPLFAVVFGGLFNWLQIRERFEGTREQQRLLLWFVADKIETYAGEVKLRPAHSSYDEALELPPQLDLEIQLLKELTWTYVIENPSLAAHQHGQRKAIQTLFEVFDEAAEEQRWMLFPAAFREQGRELGAAYGKGAIPTDQRVRLVADTIASMTDKQALIVYHQFTGVSPSSMLQPVVS